MSDTLVPEPNERELLSLEQCALLLGMRPKRFVRLATEHNLECVRGRDGRGITRQYRLGEVLGHRAKFLEEDALPQVLAQRNRCIMALRRFEMSYQAIAAITAGSKPDTGLTRARIHQIVRDEEQREESLNKTVGQVFADATKGQKT